MSVTIYFKPKGAELSLLSLNGVVRMTFADEKDPMLHSIDLEAQGASPEEIKALDAHLEALQERASAATELAIEERAAFEKRLATRMTERRAAKVVAAPVEKRSSVSLA